jgi:hypothetical protein
VATRYSVLGLLGKSLLDKLIMRDTRQFEADLKAKSVTAIERLRSDLQIRSIEHQVRFARLHEKRATVIAELYGHLVETLWEAESFLSPMEWAGEPSKREKHQTAMNKLVDFFRFFDKHRIYFPESMCASLEAIAMRVRSHVIEFGVYTRFDDQSLNEHTREQKDKAWNKGWEAIKNDIPLARKQLEDEFRKLLGGDA